MNWLAHYTSNQTSVYPSTFIVISKYIKSFSIIVVKCFSLVWYIILSKEGLHKSRQLTLDTYIYVPVPEFLSFFWHAMVDSFLVRASSGKQHSRRFGELRARELSLILSYHQRVDLMQSFGFHDFLHWFVGVHISIRVWKLYMYLWSRLWTGVVYFQRSKSTY